MKGRFPFKRLSKYPHMKPEDVAVWERFLGKNPDVFESADYDVALGRGAPISDPQPAEIRRDWAVLTKKKVDVIAYEENGGVKLMEVKPIANMRSLGQILTYRELYKAATGVEEVKAAVVAGKCDNEMRAMFAMNNVEIIIV